MSAVIYIIINNPVFKPLFLYFNNIIQILKNNKLRIGFHVNINNVLFGKSNYIASRAIIVNCKLDDYSYVGADSKITNCQVGKYTSIGPNCNIGLPSHPIYNLSTHPLFYHLNEKKELDDKIRKTTIIGNDVWIGANVTIKEGLKIGDGCIIGAGAVVTKDLPNYCISAGVPAKILKYRFDDKVIDKLRKLEWWSEDYQQICKKYENYHKILFSDN